MKPLVIPPSFNRRGCSLPDLQCSHEFLILLLSNLSTTGTCKSFISSVWNAVREFLTDILTYPEESERLWSGVTLPADSAEKVFVSLLYRFRTLFFSLLPWKVHTFNDNKTLAEENKSFIFWNREKYHNQSIIYFSIVFTSIAALIFCCRALLALDG